MAMKPAFNPDNGEMLDINGMFEGKVLYVCGTAHDDDNGRIAVNLYCGSDIEDEIALHVNPRFDENTVVRNTRGEGGGWGPEERDGELKLRPGSPFAIWIVCRKNHFKIFLNRYKVFTEYTHRVPFKLITHIQVEQNCDVHLVCSGIKGQDIPVQVFDKPSTPLDIENPFLNIRDRSITIIGRPTNSDGRFHVNLSHDDVIDFHLNPRLNERQIVRNTDDGGWGSEERDLDIPFPFCQDVPFVVKIKVNKKGFDVEINGVHALKYAKRIKYLKKIQNISICGDVDLMKVVIA